jgi:purine nucleoside phosphorylase
MSSKVNYQAHMKALKEEGCAHVILATAFSSLRREFSPVISSTSSSTRSP